MPDKNCLKMADNINTEYLDPLGMNVSEYTGLLKMGTRMCIEFR